MYCLMNRFLAIFLILSLVINLSGCATYMVHPEFTERHKEIKSVSVMPPEVDAYVLTFTGDKKRLHDIIPLMEKTTFEKLEEVFSEKGYVVKKLDLSEDVLKEKPELRTSLFNVRKLFSKSLEDIAKHRQKKFTYSLGSEVNVFADRADCDILIFIKEEGVKKSAGEIAKDVAKGLVISAAALLIGAIYLPIPRTAATIAHVAVVDSNDGAILWYNNNATNADWDPENQDHMSRLIRHLVKTFPDSVFKKEEPEKKIEKKLKEKPREVKGVVPIPATPVTP